MFKQQSSTTLSIHSIKSLPFLSLSKRFIYKAESILSEIIEFFSMKQSNDISLPTSELELFRSDTENEVIDILLKINKFLSFYNEDYTIMSLILLDKFLKMNTTFILNRNNILITILICFSLAIKVNSDEFVSNIKLSFIAGIGLEEIMNMELNFLTKINYDCFISEEKFIKYKNSFSKRQV